MLCNSHFTVLTGQVIFQVVLLDKLFLTDITFEISLSIMCQKMLLQTSLLRESFRTDITGERFLVVVLPHVQLQMMFCREHFIADLALSVLRQTDAFVDVVLQLGEEEEGLVTAPAQKPLGLVGSHVGLQARQVGADNPALMTRVVSVQLDVMNLEVVLI